MAVTLRSLLLIDPAGERLVYRARFTDGGVVLASDADDFEQLVDSVAAEANHEQDRRRRKRLDQAFDVLRDALGHGGA